MSPALRLHQFLPATRANGPGVRAALWVQGCSLGCPGCFNPETHGLAAGEVVGVDDLFDRITALGDTIEGISVSGGEPLQQREALAALLARVKRETALSVLVFTGFTWEEVQRFPEANTLLASIDVLLAGRYDESLRVARGLLGSANKTAHFLTDRYGPADLDAVPQAEVVITAEGEIVATGIDPLQWDPKR